MLNPVRLMDWMYLYQSGEDKRPAFILRTDNDTWPESLRLRITNIPDLNMRIRTGNLDEVFEAKIDRVTPVFGADIPERVSIYYTPDTAGYAFERYDVVREEPPIVPLGVALEIFLKKEEKSNEQI